MLLANFTLNSPPIACEVCFQPTADLLKLDHISQTPNNVQPTTNIQTNVAEPQKFIRLPVGLNIGKNSVIASTFVRGAEDGSQAIDFENWLVTFKDVTQVLGLNVKTLEDGQLELRSPGLITRINPKELKTDSELGLVLSIADIKNKLGVKCEFNIVDYAIVFNPPWLGLADADSPPQELPVIIEGLPKVNSDNFQFTVIGQQINITGNSNSSNINSQGNLKAIGSLFGGSWTLGIDRSDLSDISSWKLTEFQYLRQTPNADYVIGSQPTFWTSQGSGSYWGFTAIQRLGFSAKNSSGGAFSPNQRLQSEEVIHTIIGEAKPGTLVQLKPGIGNIVIREVLVDSSGVYRFENIPFGGSGTQNYRVFLYPNGQLTAQPEIQEAKSTILAGQISSGTSALMISAGLSQKLVQNNFFGSFQNWRGGLVYRRGMTEDLTLGAGIIYDQSILGLGEIFYQPKDFPVRINANVLMGTQNKGWDYNANINFNPSSRFNLNFFSDRLSQRFELNWQAWTGLSLKLSSNSRENTWIAGINLAQTGKNFSLFTSTDIDTKNNLRWNLSSTLGNFQLNYRGNEIGTNTVLSYNFSPSGVTGNSINIGYETLSSIHSDYLTIFQWRYRSKTLFQEYLPLWEFDLGYGVGSRGSGLIANASTAIIPGLNLKLRYEEISPTKDETSFKIELSPSLNLQPQLSLGDTRFERLRNEGGIFVQPFLDKNANGRLDDNEKIYIQDIDLLVIINNKNLKSYQTELTSNGVLIKLPAGIYRLDLDPAGYPINGKPLESAYAVEVIAGSYNHIRVPMTPAYTVAGKVTDNAGNPVGGVKVEAVLSQSGKVKNPVVSVTNGAGIFFLEELEIGTYNLLVNGQPAQPISLEIKPDSPLLQEINLVIKQ
ncbi:MAG TPA: carboxypeptidase-like regulatory domain-containing protein [Nostocaceae cyanobacterium]|nr:carboxypeptidase-like regulatory domain-containing protein [Nostocaceae cyanobacterium]